MMFAALQVCKTFPEEPARICNLINICTALAISKIPEAEQYIAAHCSTVFGMVKDLRFVYDVICFRSSGCQLAFCTHMQQDSVTVVFVSYIVYIVRIHLACSR